MQLDKTKLIGVEDNWHGTDFTRQGVIKRVDKDFIEKGCGYGLVIIDKNKDDKTTIYDFIYQSYITAGMRKVDFEDLYSSDSPDYVFRQLTEQEFITSVSNIDFPKKWWQRPIWKRFVSQKPINIWILHEFWDWSNYVIEYDDKWSYLDLNIGY